MTNLVFGKLSNVLFVGLLFPSQVFAEKLWIHGEWQFDAEATLEALVKLNQPNAEVKAAYEQLVKSVGQHEWHVVGKNLIMDYESGGSHSMPVSIRVLDEDSVSVLNRLHGLDVMLLRTGRGFCVLFAHPPDFEVYRDHVDCFIRK